MIKHRCTSENAATFWKWFQERGGIAVWKSVNLSNPDGSWTTPIKSADGNQVTKPTWEAEETPSLVITDPAEVAVDVPKEVKRFHVAIRMGTNGFMMKCTDGSTNRIRKAVRKAGPDAWYQFDYETQEAVIFVPGETTSLPEYVAKTQAVAAPGAPAAQP